MLHIPHHPRLDTPDIEASVEVLLTSLNFQSRSFSLSSCSHKLAKKNLCSDMHFTNITDMHLHVHACMNMHFYSIVMCPQLARIMLWYHCNIPNTDILWCSMIVLTHTLNLIQICKIIVHANSPCKNALKYSWIRVRVLQREINTYHWYFGW